MKKITIILMAVCMAMTMVSCNQNTDPKYSVGESGPAGGIIFHVVKEKKGFTYYEAAPKAAEKANRYFGNFHDGEDFLADLLSASDITSVGTGKGNTDAIMATANQAGVTIYSDQSPMPQYVITEFAAKDAATCAAGGVSDWYLPSIEELKLMYTQLKQNSLGDFADAVYWSSSQSGMQSEALSFADGEPQGGKAYDYQYYVRPIRSFH